MRQKPADLRVYDVVAVRLKSVRDEVSNDVVLKHTSFLDPAFGSGGKTGVRVQGPRRFSPCGHGNLGSVRSGDSLFIKSDVLSGRSKSWASTFAIPNSSSDNLREELHLHHPNGASRLPRKAAVLTGSTCHVRTQPCCPQPSLCLPRLYYAMCVCVILDFSRPERMAR